MSNIFIFKNQIKHWKSHWIDITKSSLRVSEINPGNITEQNKSGWYKLAHQQTWGGLCYLHNTITCLTFCHQHPSTGQHSGHTLWYVTAKMANLIWNISRYVWKINKKVSFTVVTAGHMRTLLPEAGISGGVSNYIPQLTVLPEAGISGRDK